MPQLDILSFSTQLIWMIISFGILYKFIELWFIPRIEEIIKVRKYKLGITTEGVNKIEKKESDIKINMENIKGTKEVEKKKVKQNKEIKNIKKKYLKEIVKKIMTINKK